MPLAKIKFFSSLSEQQRADIASFFYRQDFYAGQAIYNQGEPSEHLYLLAEGQALIVYANRKMPVNLFRLRAGDFFGEKAIFFQRNNHQTSALAVTDALVIKLSSLNFSKLKRFYPDIALLLLEEISAVLSRRTEQDAVSLGEIAQLGQVSSNQAELLKAILSLIPCRQAFVAIRNLNKPDCLEIKARTGLTHKELPGQIPLDTDPYLLKLTTERGPLLLPKQTYANRENVAYAKFHLLGHSLRHNDNSIGAIILADKIDGEFTDQHSLLLGIMADRLAGLIAGEHVDSRQGDQHELKRQYIGFQFPAP